MPGAPTQDTIDMVEPFLEAVGVPSSLQPSIWQGIDAAGLTVVEKTGGTPVETIDTTPAERVQAEGMPGTYLCAVKLGTRGWLSWTEHVETDGSITRGAAVFVDGDGDLLAA